MPSAWSNRSTTYAIRNNDENVDTKADVRSFKVATSMCMKQPKPGERREAQVHRTLSNCEEVDAVTDRGGLGVYGVREMVRTCRSVLVAILNLTTAGGVK